MRTQSEIFNQCPRLVRAEALFAVISLLAGCKEQAGEQMPAEGAAGSSPAIVAVSAAPTPSASTAEEPAPAAPLELQELTFTSEVKNKEPVDVLVAAEPGKRVWAHLRLRNRNDDTRKIHLEFRVNEDKRTTIDLSVSRSWSYRTWAYNTLLAADKKGTVGLTVTDDAGTVLAETSVPIAAKARTKPYVEPAR